MHKKHSCMNFKKWCRNWSDYRIAGLRLDRFATCIYNLQQTRLISKKTRCSSHTRRCLFFLCIHAFHNYIRAFNAFFLLLFLLFFLFFLLLLLLLLFTLRRILLSLQLQSQSSHASLHLLQPRFAEIIHHRRRILRLQPLLPITNRFGRYQTFPPNLTIFSLHLIHQKSDHFSADRAAQMHADQRLHRPLQERKAERSSQRRRELHQLEDEACP